MNQASVFGLLVILTAVSALEFLTPIPGSMALVEGDSTTFSCIAGDASIYPNVTYKRKDSDDNFIQVNADQRIEMSSSMYNDTEKGRLVTTTVLKIKRVILNDDESQGQWTCFASNGRAETNVGFNIYIVPKKDLPTAIIQGGGTINYGDSAKLTCDVTDGSPGNAPLAGLAWMKDNVILRNGTSATVLDPWIIKDASARDGGEYKCVGVAKLKAVVPRSLLLNKTTVYIQLKVDNGTTEVKGDEASNITMVCPAYAYPLNVTWWKMDQEQQQQLVNNERYIMSRPCPTCQYRLTIKNLQPSDVGQYICKATMKMETRMHYFKLSLKSPDEKPTTQPKGSDSSGVTHYAQSFLVLLTGLVTWKLQ